MRPSTLKALLALGTPALSDKRLWQTTWVELLVALGMLLRVVPPEIGVPALVALALGFMGQSQLGLAVRTKTLAAQVGQALPEAEPLADETADEPAREAP